MEGFPLSLQRVLGTSLIPLALLTATAVRVDAQSGVFGRWRVTGSRCFSACAMSRAEAARWRGRVATYSVRIARFADHTCTAPRYHVAYWPASGVYGGARLRDLEIAGDSALVVEVRCPAQTQAGPDPRWQVPGAFLLVRDPEHLLMVWEGVYFELTRRSGDH